MPNIKKYDYLKICKDRECEYIREDNPYIYIRDKYGFEYKVSRTRFANGSELTGKSVINATETEYFLHRLKLRHPNVFNILDFSKFRYTKAANFSLVTCIKHGVDIDTKPNWLLSRGSCCTLCKNEANSERLKIDNSEFIRRSIKRNGSYYDYSKSNYIGCRSNVTITCPKHGDFTILAHYHTVGGLGCSECSSSGGYGAKDYAKICKNGSGVYLMKFESESEMFYKIGISKEIKRRLSDLSKHYSYDVKLIYYKEFNDSESVWYIENMLHNEYSNVSYLPKIKFKGHTECFSEVNENEFIKIIECVA